MDDSPNDDEDDRMVREANATPILPFLFLGNERDATDEQRLHDLAISYVLNVTAKPSANELNPDQQKKSSDDGTVSSGSNSSSPSSSPMIVELEAVHPLEASSVGLLKEQKMANIGSVESSPPVNSSTEESFSSTSCDSGDKSNRSRRYKWLPASDNYQQNLKQYFEEAYQFIGEYSFNAFLFVCSSSDVCQSKHD